MQVKVTHDDQPGLTKQLFHAGIGLRDLPLPVPCDPNDVFLEQPDPVLEPANGMQVELICRVTEMYRTVWSVYIPFHNYTRRTESKLFNDYIATNLAL